ncbi:MAG TPA: HD domain-containing phosphohydrolase [Planctomycetota bacterium]|nr:HD domain-containing phosphohydrolase [Planctomycetota bacterium]
MTSAVSGIGTARILVVDDEEMVRRAMAVLLKPFVGWTVTTAGDAASALAYLDTEPFDAVVADIHMPGVDGFALLSEIRRRPRTADLPVVVVTGASERDLKRRALDLGATDLLTKPVDGPDLVARLRSVLRLKDFQDQLRRHNEELEETVRRRTAQLESARLELIWRLGKAAEFRDSETGSHVVRVGFFAMEIAREMGVDRRTAATLFHTAPLHDIGKLGIPDQILLKPGKLTPEEWEVMKGHARIGADLLRSDALGVQRAWDSGDVALPQGDVDRGDLLDMAANIANYHHERWDGGGYPEGLLRDAIPLEARITALADVFDALSSKRPYKAAFDDAEVLALVRRGAGTQFDPAVSTAFEARLPRLREIQVRFRDAPAPPAVAARFGLAEG